MRFIGIDPGITGSVSVIKPNGEVKIYPTPTLIRKTRSRKKNRTKDYDLVKCRKLLKRLTRRRSQIWLEGVHSFLGGKVANFLLGRSRGIWEGLIAGLGLTYNLVDPITWSCFFFGKGKRENKKKLNRRRVVKLYPSSKKYFKLKKHDELSDSLLIASYGKLVRRRS